MYRVALPIVAVILLAGAAAAQEQLDVYKILDRAIEAHGGETALTKHTGGTAKNKGRLEILNGLDFTQTVSYQLPDKFREEMELEVNGNRVTTSTTYNAGKSVLIVNGKKIDLGEKLNEALKEAGQLLEMAKLVGLKNKAFELSLIGDATVDDQPAVGIRVVKKGNRDVGLYFNKKTGLLAKTERRTVDPMSGQEVMEERIVTEYQKIDGLPQPKRVLVNRDGKKFMEVEVLELKLFEKLDDGMFAIP